MSFVRCSICGKYDFMDRHRCSPSWYVLVEDEKSDYEKYPIDVAPRKYYAETAEGAAVAGLAEWNDEYKMRVFEVFVSGSVLFEEYTKFLIETQPSIEYSVEDVGMGVIEFSNGDEEE